MSPADLELMEIVGELVLTKRAADIRPLLIAGGVGAGVGAGGLLASQKLKKKDFTDAPAAAGEAVSTKLKQTRQKAREAGAGAMELAKDPLFLGSAVGGSALSMYLLHKINNHRKAKAQRELGIDPKLAFEKQAIRAFGPAGKALDWLLGKGFAGAKKVAPSPKTMAEWGVRKPFNVAMEAGGIRGLSKERQLLAQILKSRGGARDWKTVQALADARGVKSPATFIGSLFSPMQTMSGRLSQGGRARWLLGEHLRDPKRMQQFLHGATPAQKAALQRLMKRHGTAATEAGQMSLAGQLLPFGLVGGPLAYNLIKGPSDDGQRPVVSAPNMGLLDRNQPKEPNAVQRLWSSAGDKVRGVSPGLGDWISEHPYLSTAGAAGLAGGGLYGLTRMFGGDNA